MTTSVRLPREAVDVLVMSILLCIWSTNHILLPQVQAAGVSCTSTSQCETQLRKGSQCVNGFCSNPYGSGCLINHKPGWTRKRVCNSDDPPDSGVKGICRPPRDDFNYMEIRIAVQNWESVYFEAYILQIILSEILDVPTTLETGSQNAVVNLYDPTNRFEYGKSNLFNALVEGSTRKGGCYSFHHGEKGGNNSSQVRVPCAHVIPEVWAGHEATLNNLTLLGLIEPPSYIGVVGQEGLYMPKFTGLRDPTLMSYHGLAGPQNRRKLAERFLRPTTWGDYCTDVSVSKCQKSDNVTTRAPVDDKEKGRYFVDGLYTGYFRKTEENDCDQWPSNCTGHVADYPCGWHSYIVPQSYWLDIGLKSNGKEPSGGYTYNQLSDIWNAANATQSDIMTVWWNPEAVYQLFLSTFSQMEFVEMPPADPICIENRINTDDRCNGTFQKKVGDKDGVCVDPPLALLKVMTTSLARSANDPTIMEALRSPGYEAMKNFRITNVDLSIIFDYWLHSPYDKYSFGPREATCRWFVEKFDTLLGLMPATYPRVLEESSAHQGAFPNAALGLGAAAVVVVLVSCVITYRQRLQRVMRYAQVDFMFLLLFGLILVSVGAIVQVMKPTGPKCVAIIWLINVGYTLELVPLIVKVAAINKLMQAARKMRRVELTKKGLFGAVAWFCLFVAAFLMIWTIIDPPRKETAYTLTTTMTKENQTIILTDSFCQTSVYWTYIVVASQIFLLVSASVLAFQTRKLRKDLNETQTLAFLIYSHFLFVALRVTIIALGENINVATSATVLSLIYSLDTIATIMIYFVPKFLLNHFGDKNIKNEWLKLVLQQAGSVSGSRAETTNDPNVTSSFSRPMRRDSSDANGTTQELVVPSAEFGSEVSKHFKF